MIAKISTSTSPRGALLYNYEKFEEGQALILFTNRIWKSENEEFSANRLAHMFEKRAALNQNTKNPFVHISLNPSPNDKLTNEQLTEIAEEYMQKMGFGDQPFVVFKHEDIDRHHLHIVTTNINEQGKKINDSYSKLESKKITNELERKYNLHPADISKDLKIWTPQKIDTTKKISSQMRNTVRHLSGYKFQSFNEYRALLSLYNIEVQEVKGETNGLSYHGAVYAATDDAGNQITNQIKASSLGKFAGVPHLQKQFDVSKLSKKVAEELKKTLSLAMNSTKTEEALKQALKKKNIDLLLRKNESGRIYGVTIIDHKSKNVLNGSRLGKEFSANQFHNLLNSSDAEERSLNPMIGKEQILQRESEPNIPAAFDILGAVGAPIKWASNGQIHRNPKKKKRKRKD